MSNDIASGFQPLRKCVPIFIIIDISGSMRGEKIGKVNEMMEQFAVELQELQEELSLYDFMVRVITYGDGNANWRIGHKNMGILAKDFQWKPICQVETLGGEPADKAMELLASVSENREYLGWYISTPTAILVSEGESTGQVPFSVAVDKFRDTKYGASFIQIAVGVGVNEKNFRAVEELEYFGINGVVDCMDNPEQTAKRLVRVLSYMHVNSPKYGIRQILSGEEKAIKEDSPKPIEGDNDIEIF